MMRNMTSPYKDKCSICKSPAANTICSNVKCKSWRKYRQLAAGKVIEQGLTRDNPITIYCPICNGHGRRMRPHTKSRIYCPKCRNYQDYLFIAEKWYHSCNDGLYGNIPIITYFDGYIWDYEGEKRA